MITNYKKVNECRICDSKELETYIDFGDMPLVNSLQKPGEENDTEKFPLAVNFCGNCSLSQLTVSVNPEILFSNYLYRSSISSSFGKHCGDLADELNYKTLKKDDLVIDLASNDGYLLDYFKIKGNKVLGIDPAKNLAKIANQRGINTLDQFWDEPFSKKVFEEYGPAKIITAFNVLAHVPDINSFVRGAKNVLDENGYFIIESPHIQKLLDNSEFDTIYHEHVSYLSVKSVQKLMDINDLRIAKVKKFPIHGGSVRFYVEHKNSKNTSDGSLEKILEEEKVGGIHSIEGYQKLEKKVKKVKENLLSTLQPLKNSSKKICAFGASAKGNILLNYCHIDNNLISFIFDDTPEKQGLIFPGTRIPIVSREEIKRIGPEYLVLLAWNFAEEMMAKTKEFSDNGGRYIIPLPELKII